MVCSGCWDYHCGSRIMLLSEAVLALMRDRTGRPKIGWEGFKNNKIIFSEELCGSKDFGNLLIIHAFWTL